MVSHEELITTALSFDMAEPFLGNILQEPVPVRASSNLTLPFLPEPHVELAELIDFHTLPVNQAELESNIAQVMQMSYVLEGGGIHYVWAPNQSGKTIIALMLCALTHRRGLISLYMTDRLTTVRQTCERAKQFLDIPEEDIVFLTGLSPEDRAHLYKREGPLVVIGTAERVANDMKAGLIPLERVGAEIYDEAHHFSEGDVTGSLEKGYETYRMNACIKVRSFLKDVAGLTTLLLSATPAATIEKWKRARPRIGDFEFYALNQEEQHLPEIARERDCELTPAMAQAVEDLSSILERITKDNPWIEECLEEIKKPDRKGKRSGKERRRQQEMTFDDSGEDGEQEAAESRTPVIGVKMCEKLIEHVKARDDWKEKISAAYEYQHVQRLARNLTRFGRYLFLEAVADSLARYQPERKPAYLSRLYRDECYCSAVYNVAIGTPYQAMLDVSRDAPRINIKADVSQARRNEWREALLADGLNDHSRMRKTVKLLREMLEENREEKVIIAVDSVEETRLMKDFLGTAAKIAGIRVARITGKNTERQQEEARKQFETKFAEGGCNVLIGTSAVYAGIDLELVNRGIVYACPDEPIELKQLLGRFGRTRDPHTSGVRNARVHFLLTPQSPDELFLNLGLGQMENMRRELLKESRVVNGRG